MLSNTFRTFIPVRTCTNQYTVYTRYKSILKKDFNGRCGYTDSPDNWFGGSKCFHIDHFKPKDQFPELSCSYSNLVYCCSHVNNKKSNKIGLFLDPCDVDMNDHFFRDDHANICAKETSAEAQFMMKELALNQRRYGLIWQLEQLQLKLEEITVLLDKHLNLETKEELILLRLYKETSSMFQKYFKYLGTEL